MVSSLRDFLLYAEKSPGVFPATRKWRQLAKEDLRLFMVDIFPDEEEQDTYGQILVDNRIISVGKLQQMNKELLERIGFSALDAELVLSNCSLTTVAVTLADSHTVVGNIQAALRTKLRHVKEIILKDNFPGLQNQTITFLHGGVLSPVTTEREKSWTLRDVIMDSTAGKTIFVSKDKAEG